MAELEANAEQALPPEIVEGQLIMPFYVICDVSASMHGDMPELNAALGRLLDDIVSNPIVDDLTMLSVITFESAARTVVPLSSPSEVSLPLLHAGGGTNYGNAFREYSRAFEADRRRLKSQGKRVYRPCMFFLSDGMPGDTDYLETFQALLAYDPETKQGNRAFPYVAAFGFRDASEQVMRSLAYPNFGRSRGRWFISRSADIGDLLMSMTDMIGNTVVSAGASAGAGIPQIVPPVPPMGHGLQFGEAGDFVD